MRNFRLLTAILIIIFICTDSCKKNNKNETKTTFYYDLTPDEVAFWDSQPSVDVDSNNVILPNGLKMVDFLAEINSLRRSNVQSLGATPTKTLGPQDARNELIANLTSAALKLTNRNNFVYKADPSDPQGKPAQNGLAYSWGQRDYSVRETPPGDGNLCPAQVYGLDCSGFLYQVFNMSGIQISKGTADQQRNPANIQAAIQTAYPQLSKLKIEDLGKITNFKTGDIIYWIEADGTAHHIGIILDNDGELEVAQSNGSPTDGCEANYGSRRGPRWSKIANAILPSAPAKKGDPKGFGDNYGVVRINGDISGAWGLSIRCEGTTTNLFTLALNFPADKQNSFPASVTAKDYDGSTNAFHFNFAYDNIANTLTTVYTMNDSGVPGFQRKDSITVTLNRDSTGYLPAQNIYLNNGSGCPELIQISDKEVQNVGVLLGRRKGPIKGH